MCGCPGMWGSRGRRVSRRCGGYEVKRCRGPKGCRGSRKCRSPGGGRGVALNHCLQICLAVLGVLLAIGESLDRPVAKTLTASYLTSMNLEKWWKSNCTAGWRKNQRMETWSNIGGRNSAALCDLHQETVGKGRNSKWSEGVTWPSDTRIWFWCYRVFL